MNSFTVIKVLVLLNSLSFYSCTSEYNGRYCSNVQYLNPKVVDSEPYRLYAIVSDNQLVQINFPQGHLDEEDFGVVNFKSAQTTFTTTDGHIYSIELLNKDSDCFKNMPKAYQCNGLTKSGQQCQRLTDNSSGYCWQHSNSTKSMNGANHKNGTARQEAEELYSKSIGSMDDLDKIDFLERALVLDPYYAEAYRRLGVIQESAQLLNSCIETCSRCILLTKSPDCYAQRAECHFDLKNWSKAIDDYSTAYELDNTDLTSLHSIGFIYSILGDHVNAKKYYQLVYSKSLNMFNDCSKIGNEERCKRNMILLFEDYFEIEDFDSALEVLEAYRNCPKCGESNVDDDYITYHLGRVHFHLKNYSASDLYFDDFISKGLDRRDLNVYLDLLAKLGY